MLWGLLIISLIGSAHAEALCNRMPLNGTTSQSSHYIDKGTDYISERAIDGNKSICAHTLEKPNSWWTIDLQGVQKISAIFIFYSQHKHANIDGFQIHIGNSNDNNGTNNRVCTTITNLKENAWNSFKCNTEMSGRYITVHTPQTRFLILCEVQICSTKQVSPFKLIKMQKTWEEALHYCRDNYKDLASILDERDQAWAELEASQAGTPFVWLGLRYTCVLEFWFWLDDHGLEFNRWDSQNEIGHCDMSGAMETKGDYRWFKKPDNTTFHFICAK